MNQSNVLQILSKSALCWRVAVFHPSQRNFKGVSYSMYLYFSTEITDVLKFLQAVTPTVVLKRSHDPAPTNILNQILFHFTFY